MHNIFWALIILFAVAALLRMDWAYYLVYVVGGVWVLSHVWLRYALARLTVTRLMPGRAFANERVAVQLRLDNRGLLPLPWVQVQEAVPLDLKDQEAAVPIGAGCKVCERPSCPQRAFPAIGRRTAIDENERRFTPYPVA